MSSLIFVVKGQLPKDLNNPSGQMTGGWIATYALRSNMALAEEPVKTPAAVPFSNNEDEDDSSVFFFSEVTSGFAVYRAGSNASVVQGTIPSQSASCWAAQSTLSRSFYVVQIAGKSNITEVSIHPTTLTGTILSTQSLGVNASGTDLSIFSGPSEDWMYVNAPGYQSVHAFSISGPGKFNLRQCFDLKDMSDDVVATAGFALSPNDKRGFKIVSNLSRAKLSTTSRGGEERNREPVEKHERVVDGRSEEEVDINHADVR